MNNKLQPYVISAKRREFLKAQAAYLESVRRGVKPAVSETVADTVGEAKATTPAKSPSMHAIAAAWMII